MDIFIVFVITKFFYRMIDNLLVEIFFFRGRERKFDNITLWYKRRLVIFSVLTATVFITIRWVTHFYFPTENQDFNCIYQTFTATKLATDNIIRINFTSA